MTRNAKLGVLEWGEDSEIGKLILTFPCWFCLNHDHEDYREHRHLEVHCDDSFPRLLTELARQLEEALHYRQHFTSDLHAVHNAEMYFCTSTEEVNCTALGRLPFHFITVHKRDVFLTAATKEAQRQSPQALFQLQSAPGDENDHVYDKLRAKTITLKTNMKYR